jgi:hypothetical protein
MDVPLMNGYEIIGFVKGRNDGVILGRRQGHRGPEWVTARVDVQQDEWPREWFWGHYFESDSEAAFADFIKRSSECNLEVTQSA